ncbi:MAG: MFS transporter [Henriciella sp.]|nr:MFS transporter [Henriciella sp.]
MSEQFRRLKKRTIAAYGVGDLGFNLFYTTLSLFLLIYYTNVLNIAPVTAGFMAAGPVLWDAITDPIMGLIASRTKTRFGAYRPYILFGAPLCGLSFVAMFAAPVLFPSAVIVSSVIAHLIFRTLYTVVNVPYTAMTVVLTDKSKERGYLAASRMIGAMTAGLLAAILMFPMAEALGGGDIRLGFVWVASLYAIIATIAMLVVGLSTQETNVGAESSSQLSFGQTLRFLKGNSVFWILAAAIFLGSIGSTIGINSLNYYVADYVGAPGQQRLVLLPLLLGFGISIPIWTWVATKTSKARTWVIAGVPSVLVSIVMFGLAPKSLEPLAALILVKGLFSDATPVLLWSMAPDTVEFGEWKSGVRDEAIGFGLIQLALKSASSLAAFALGAFLAVIQYQAPEVRAGALSDDTLEGLRFAAFILPTVFTVAGLIAISQYRLDHTLHARLSRVLAWRRRAT